MLAPPARGALEVAAAGAARTSRPRRRATPSWTSSPDLDGDHGCFDPGEPTPAPDTSLPLERTITDFEDGTLNGLTSAYDAVLVTDADIAPATTRGAYSALLLASAPTETWLSVLYTYDTVVVQHSPAGTGAWSNSSRSSFRFYVEEGVDGVSAPHGAPGAWSQTVFDVTAHCGQPGYLRIAAEGWPSVLVGGGYYGYADEDGELVDDIGFAGSPCPVFVDGDADGLCREGVDLDGDGLCVDGAEPTPGVVQDPNDPS